MTTNCPNCNAVLSYEGGLHCDYCGAWFEEPRYDEDETVYYNDDGPYYSTKRGPLTVNSARTLSGWPSPENLETR